MTDLLPARIDVEGVNLHVGDIILDPVDGHTPHRIAVLDEYRGQFCGDHARRAHEQADWRDVGGWGATICDRHHYWLIAA